MAVFTSALTSAPAFVMGPGKGSHGRPLYVVGSDIWVKISSLDTGGAFAVMEDHTPAQAGPPLHLHREQDEWWFVLEGDYRFEVDGKQILAGPGSTVFAPRGSRHAFQNIGAKTGRTITVATPGGLDFFFEELEKVAPRGTAPDPAVLVPLFEKYDLELLGAPLSAR